MSAWIDGFLGDDNSCYYCGGPLRYDAGTVLLTVTWCLACGQRDLTEDMCVVIFKRTN